MNNPDHENFDIKSSLKLFGLHNYLNDLIKIFNIDKLPKVILLSGRKGIGKSTLVNHFLTYIFDKKNYDLPNKVINSDTIFYKQYTNKVFPNIAYLSGSHFRNIKIENIRDLKKLILTKSLSNNKRFIIFDDVEIFSNNCLNALLKILEEPTDKNYFILINNNSKKLLDTIYSRSTEFRIFLTANQRIDIIENLIKKDDIVAKINYKQTNITPGNFLKFNKIILENDINLNLDFTQTLDILLSIYKKDKDMYKFNMILFLVDYHFQKVRELNKCSIEKIINDKNFIINNINNFITFNINQKSLINAINNKLNNG